MKKSLFLALAVLVSSSAFASALGTAARSVIPAEVQQIITVDYRKMTASQAALALKQRLMPDNLKQFETALKGVGITSDRDLDQLTFASFRAPDGTLHILGIAGGNFQRKAVLKQMSKRKIRPTRYRETPLYAMSGGLQMTFLDDSTIMFAQQRAMHLALDTRDGERASLNSNSQVTDLIGSVDSAAIWSVLDAQGTQTMMRSALGEAAQLADYETVKKRLVGSRYAMDFSRDVQFDLDVITSDSLTAATLSSLLKAGMMYKRMNASSVEKNVLENVTVDSDNTRLKVNFRTDDRRFQSLLNSDLFAAVSR
jgi:hypothetical protein